MLYVFLVDTGIVYTFDMNIALDTVANLKENVFRVCNVPTEKQVLLISGGQSLDPTHRVCSYSAGTDTNPIFLFCKSTIESSIPPSPSINYGSAQELKDKLEVCLADKETTYQTVAARAQLAQQLHETAREITRVCEQLVYDQHMQQQGWSAVVANLEDIVLAFKGRADLFEQTYHQYLNSREENLKILSHFCDDLAILSDIPVLESLINNNGSSMSLLDWIRSNDDENTNLNMVADHCTKALEQMDHQLLVNLEKHIESSLDSAERPEMKEIGGLAERLYGLEQLLVEARKKVQEQGELAQALHQNQQRARNLNDTSILPDLCASHRQQLKLMLKHDEKLRDIRNRCSRAKEELSNNLHARLRWVMFVQRQLAEVDSGLALQHENLRRLRRHFDLLRQLHLAPSIYLQSLIEVVRRKLFVSKFTQWATTLAGHSLSVHNGEIVQRKTFSDSCEGHFLTLLFPGIVDQFSPLFATSPPAAFDTNLPSVTIDDLEKLKQALPSLWSTLKLPENLKDVIREPMLLDWLHSSSQNLGVVDIQMPTEARVLPSLTAALLSPPIRPLQSKLIKSKSDLLAPSDHEETSSEARQPEEILKEQRSQLLALKTHFQCALETVQNTLPALRNEMNSIQLVMFGASSLLTTITEEWKEKVIQQVKLLLAAADVKCRERVNAEKRETARVEQEKLKSEQKVNELHLTMEEWVKRSLQWQEEKKEMIVKSQQDLRRREGELEQAKKEQLQQCVQQHQSQMDALKEQIKNLKIEHQRTLNHWKSCSEQDDPEAVKAWRQELMLSHEMELEQVKLEHESELNELQLEVRDSKCWQDKYEALLKEGEAEKIQIQQNLQHKHRLEIEGLRSRFRIMASTTLGDRSPSEISLEKVDMRPTPPASPRNIIPAMTNNHAEKYLSESSLDQLEQEKDKLVALVGEFRVHCKQGNFKTTKWEGTFANALQEASQILANVTNQVTDTFKGDSIPHRNPLTTSISVSSPYNMAASVSVLQSSDDKSFTNITHPKTSTKKKPMSKTTRTLVRQGSANVYGCEVGDAVLVQWDERYSTHMLYNKGPYLHFLHADSISGLKLQNVIEPFLARVLQREFCLVRKEENRYNLPKGTNFYRVKVEKMNKINNGQ